MSSEKTYSRKLNEIFLSLHIEQRLSKDEILELYINKIYLGNRSHGFAAAANVYYGKDLRDISLTEAAMLAGLPKAPSRYNPLVNPERAKLRRNYVLGRLLALNMIDRASYVEAVDSPVTAKLYFAIPESEADYVGEMARARVKEMYGDEWSTAGFRVYTTIRSDAQRAANRALRVALLEYEERHGYIGPLGRLESSVINDQMALREALSDFQTHGDLSVAVVVDANDESAMLRLKDGSDHVIDLAAVEWARERITIDKRGDEVAAVNAVLQTGDVVSVLVNDDGSVRFTQEPQVEGAFVSMTPYTGEITALVGRF